MPLPYNNNGQDARLSVTTFSPISFANPEGELGQSRMSINYFNRLMQVKISPRVVQAGEQFPSYSKEGVAIIFITPTNAKMLHDGFINIITGKSKFHSVHIETKGGLFTLSDGIDKGSPVPYASVTFVLHEGAKPTTLFYQFKTNYELACDYNDGAYETQQFPRYEIDTFLMVLEQYYIASSYAIAATINESNLYRHNYIKELIRSIAMKVGVNLTGVGGQYSNNSNGNTQTFLNKSQQNTTPPTIGFDPSTAPTGGVSGMTEGYTASTFDDLVKASLEGLSALEG